MVLLVKLNKIKLSDVSMVGGKNASLGEMIQQLSSKGIKVPGGFATTTEAYRKFLKENDLDKKITQALASLKTTDIPHLEKTAQHIQHLILAAPFSKEFEHQVAEEYANLNSVAVAVRSSATAEDLATASFAGQQETYLNVKGLKNVLQAIKKVYASLFTSRTIVYRGHHSIEESQIFMSAGIQPMIRSDKGVSGIMFTLDTESGFDQVITLTSSYGLGEAIAQGQVNPDEFCISKPLLRANKFAILQRKLGEKAVKVVYKNTKNSHKSIKTVAVAKADRERFSLNDNEICILAQQALLIEEHYGKHMDVEWAKDGISGELFILQARPETTKSKVKTAQNIEKYVLSQKGKVLVEGQSIGQRIGKGVARIILNPKKMNALKEGEVLVTSMTNPDWEPVMKRAAAIVTNRGGRTCHAAIIARELGIPAVIGCGDATKRLKDGDNVTVSCAEGQTGYVYEGLLAYEQKSICVSHMPKLPIKLCMNLGNPDKAFACQNLPNEGIGLARLEFIISNMIGIHPNALLNFANLPKKLKQQINKKIMAYENPREFYIEKLREGIAIISAAFYPKQVIFRFSDFKSNEYANLMGGYLYEPKEENPMLGYRGASRYTSESFCKCFELECQAFVRVREQMGLTNAQVMVPFVRTVEELQQVIKLMETYGLKRGVNGLKVFMMCEIPSNALLAEEFLKYVDGFSIGSNDLTQLTLGIDRDASTAVAPLFDERNEAIKILLHKAISECLKQNKYIGICGQGPSDYPDFAEWLMIEGMQNISLNPDTIVETWLMLSEKVANSKNMTWATKKIEIKNNNI